MPSGPIRPLLASTGFRIALLQAGLLTVAMAAAASGAWIATRDLVARDLRSRISVEVEAIRLEATREGLSAAAEAVMARAERPGALEYRLVDAAGHRLAGDLGAPVLQPGWTNLVDMPPEPDGDRHARILVFTADLPGGAQLSVGDDVTRGTAMRDAIFRAIASWGAAALALGLVASIWLTRRALGRMKVVSDTISAAGRGDLAARTALPLTSGDDIDMLARGVDDMLDRIGILVAAVRRVSADVAHELRTPLMHLGQRLEQAAAAPDAQSRQIALVAASADLGSALRLFDAMLRLAEIDAGASRSRFTLVDLGEVAERVADAYRPEFEASGRVLDASAIVSAHVLGDADLIAQLLANLLDNAIKFTAAGACITVSVRCHDAEAVLTVADDGPGIDAESLDSISDPFRRSAAAGDTVGSGLGLAIVDAVARLHAARYRLEDGNPGLVARVRFALTTQQLAPRP